MGPAVKGIEILYPHPLPVITPFHFACHCEERFRAQAAIIDAPLSRYIHSVRRTSLMENHASINFGKHIDPSQEFASHVTLNIHQVPQKDEKTAFNCTLTCPSEKMTRNFRLLITRVEETENEILRVLQFLQKAFAGQDYVKNAPAMSAEETAAANAPAPAIAQANPSAAGRSTNEAPKKKYVFEKELTPGDTVRMRTHEGKYVPEGELPARLRINKPGETNPPVAAAPAAEAAVPASTDEAPATTAAGVATPVETPATPSGESQA